MNRLRFSGVVSTLLILAACSSPSTDTGDQGVDDVGGGDGFTQFGDVKSDTGVKDTGGEKDSGEDAKSDAVEEVLIVDIVGDAGTATCKTADDCIGKIDVPECHKAACNPNLGKCFVALLIDGTACTGQGDLCVEGAGTCLAGQCQGTPKNCDDKNVCTDDTCDPKAGCLHAPNTAPCDDGNKCTSGETCAEGACVGGTSTCTGGPEVDCSNKKDDDGDGLTDCADNDCAADAACKNLPKETVCDNQKDDDGDGLTDCADSDCSGVGGCAIPAHETNCTDKVDDDKDGAIDCADNDCASNPACSKPLHELNCKDGIDEDVDGKTDCGDSDCVADPACTGGSKELNCGDGVDNDKDGATDCADNDCAANPPCAPTGETDCGNGVDDDKDGKTDCADTDCAKNQACVAAKEANCTDKIDNDKDGYVDCNDVDCAGDAACVSKCSHDTCTQGGKLTKGCDPCVDAVCKSDAFCCSTTWDDTCTGEVGQLCGKQCPGAVETICNDGKDNDTDGFIDCDDSDCKADPSCVAVGCSAAGSPLTCGGATTGKNSDQGSTQKIAGYTCVDGPANNETGPEFVQALTAECDGDITISLEKTSTAGGFLDLFLLDGSVACAPTTCLAHGLMSGKAAQIVAKAKKGQQFWVVVDGYAQFTGSYALKVACGCTAGKETACADKVDNDGDGATDCQDTDCAADLACTPTVETACGNQIDDDKDGKVDCADTDCVSAPACASPTTELICNDKVDNDKDGTTDCADSDCAKDLACAPALETICDDGLDNDSDGFVDCGDSDCAGSSKCQCVPDYPLAVGTSDSWSNNGSGSTNVVTSYACPTGNIANETGSEYTYSLTANCDGELTVALQKTGGTTGFLDLFLLDGGKVCGGGACLSGAQMSANQAIAKLTVSNGQKLDVVVDGYQGFNGAYTIKATCVAIETKCGNKIDDDNDGKTDCTDSDCAKDLACAASAETLCDDKIDNDKDGATDCGDSDCAANAECAGKVETACADGKDNDSDGKTDCADSDCATNSACTCAPAYPLTCGDSDAYGNALAGSTKIVDAWQCKDGAVANETGAEYTYDYTATCTGNVTATLKKTSGGAGFLDLFLLDGAATCNGSSCLAHAIMTTTQAKLTFAATQGAKYAIAVDGYNGFSGNYTLDIACDCKVLTETECNDGTDNDSDGAVDCADSDCAASATCVAGNICKPDYPIACGGGDGFNNSGPGSTSAVDTWTCTDGSFSKETGPEFTYSYVADCNGTATVTVTNAGATGFLDLYILDGAQACTPNACTSHALMTGGKAIATFPVTAGQKFNFVVDGYNGFSGNYSITAACACK
jgi:hypothetical protein